MLSATIDEHDVKELASYILHTKNTQYRNTIVYTSYIGNNNNNKQQHYHVYPAADTIASNVQCIIDLYFDEVNKLSESVRNNSSIDMYNIILQCYRISTRIHCDIVSIHAFNDGNGRLSRILMNNTLACITPFMVTIDVDKQDYIDTLQHARNVDSSNTPSDLCALILYCAHKQWNQLFHTLHKNNLM